MNKIKLYRGDHSKIKEFQVSKTNKRCLVGPGIYLTNNIDVAHSYRIKTGMYSRAWSKDTEKELSLEMCKTTNKGEAIAASFSSYFEKYWMVKYQPTKKVSHQAFAKYQELARRQYHFDIEDGIVRFTRQKRTVMVENVNLRTSKDQKYLSLIPRRTRTEDWISCDVDNPNYEKVGYISVFDFDLKEVNSLFVKLGFMREVYCSDLFSDITKEHDIQWEQAESGLYVKANLANARLAKQYFEPYGYKGIEYCGGSFTNSTRHRAFAVWDEDFINQHFVRRIQDY